MSDLERPQEDEERERQSRKMEAIGTLTSGVAHDFSNLLMGIDGCAEIALRELESDHPARRYVAQIKDAVTRGTALTRQLLAFSRSSSGEVAIVELDEAVESVEQLLRPLLDVGIRLEVDLAAEGARVESDDGGIEQIALNLIVNARDAVGGNGRIVVRTERLELDAPRSVDVGEVSPGHWAVLEVGDDGAGMDRETVEQIFDPFFTTKPVGEGTGLGLSTVYGIVGQVGGAIEVESRPGDGAVFRIYLPVTDAAPRRERPSRRAGEPEPPSAAAESTPGVLIVEDNDIARSATEELLKSEGFAAYATDCGRGAREIFERRADDIDIVLMDLTLPDTEGRKLADQLRAGGDSLPVIFVSGAVPDEALVDGTLDVSGTRFLQKPVGLETLLMTMRELLRT